MSFARIVGKMANAVAPVASTLIIDKMRQDALAERDKRLQEYDQTVRTQERAYQTERDNMASLERSDERNMDRAERLGDKVEDRRWKEEQMKITKKGVAMEEERLGLERGRMENEELTQDQQRTLIDKQLLSADIDLEQKKELRNAVKILDDPNASADQKKRAETIYSRYTKGNYQVVKGGPVYDENGYPTGAITPDKVLNKNTGKFVGEDDMDKDNKMSEFSTPEKVRTAYRTGKISREEAKQLIKNLGISE